jgi:peptidoglycan/LPS O-acetylase OafA/YrhL
MKKASLIFILSALVLITVGVWFFSGSNEIKPMDIVSLGVIILVVAFAVFVGYKKLSSARHDEPAEDELSKKVMRKTAAWSFYISPYLWLAIMYFSDKFQYETHTFIAAGILGMAVIFAICWLVFNFRGIRDE